MKIELAIFFKFISVQGGGESMQVLDNTFYPGTGGPGGMTS